MNRSGEAPAWVGYILIPLLNIFLAFFVSGLIIVAIGENPFEAVKILVYGAFGTDEFIGYTLYYTTNLIFTGLAVAVAFHAGLFNIGGEGQAYIGGLGVGIVILATDNHLPFALILPLAILGSALFGAAWAFIPAYLQAKRGSHVVITTIMFNFIAAALMNYLLVNILIKPGQMSPETREFMNVSWLPFAHEAMGWFGIKMTASPLNAAFLWALICCLLVWLMMWRSRLGFAIRTIGANETGAVYGGIKPARIIIITMCISGGLAGFVGLNEIMGVQHRLMLNFTAGVGFVGIAVALMGRSHPIGIVFAAILFGALYQGGAELAFEIPKITREMVVVIQGLVILFCGALEFMLQGRIEALFTRRAATTTAGG